LPVGRHTIFERVDSDGMHRKFVRGSEYTDRDFLHLRVNKSSRLSRISHTPRLATSSLVKGPWCPAPLRRIE
jgi:hypothetical protein